MAVTGDALSTIGLLDNDLRSLQSLNEIVHELMPRYCVRWMVTKGELAEERCLDPRTRPDILLVDMSLYGMPGSVVCRRIRERISDMPILAMTSFPVSLYKEKSLLSGAQGICSKNSEDELITSIDFICRGGVEQSFQTADEAHRRLMEERGDRSRGLTPKEMEIMDCVTENMSDREIADMLGLAPATIRRHIYNAKTKLHAKNRFQAALMWLKGEGW